MAAPSGRKTAMGERPGADIMGVFLFVPGQRLLSWSASAEYASTWLGSSMAARSACKTAMGERPGADIMGVFFICPRAAPTLLERLSRVRKYLVR